MPTAARLNLFLLCVCACVSAAADPPASPPGPRPPLPPGEGRGEGSPRSTFAVSPAKLPQYVETFNRNDQELYRQHVPNAAAARFLADNIPLLDCPDKDIEEIYYFRWWTYRKHIKQTPSSFIITEFLPRVSWAGKHNSISCAAGHHLYEGRWLHDPKYLDDYCVFWFRKGGEPRRYSFWAADAIWARCLATGRMEVAKDLLPDLVKNYEAWEKSNLDPSGLFWQIDDRDGGEMSIGGHGLRATINSYMYGDAVAIARMAEHFGQKELAGRFRAKAQEIKRLTEEKLWDQEAQFFKVLPRGKNARPADVRELHGYTPWYFNLPDTDKAVAWKQLLDPQGFSAPFGPTTAERRHPKFAISYRGHECQWNGPSWPYATAVTLTALANLLNGPPPEVVTRKDYLNLLKVYAKSQHRTREDGTVLPWIDENLNPLTGDWLARTRLKSWRNGGWDPGKGGVERGKDYNHSTYCDLVITGLVGLRPRADEVVEVNPLVPEGAWDYFCLDRVLYHGRMLTILYDKTGGRYGRGRGLRIFADGRQIAAADTLQRLTAPLPPVLGQDNSAGARSAAPTAAPAAPKLPSLRPLFDYSLRDTSICLGGDGLYYLTGTTGHPTWWTTNEGIRLWRSADLKKWEPLGLIWKIDDGTWQRQEHGGKRALWAPEIHYIKGTFWLTHCMNFGGTGLLKSTSGQATGPYRDVHPQGPLTGQIDASLFADDDGKVYFVWQNGMIARLNDEMNELAEKPRHLKPSNHSQVGFEGAFLTKIGKRYCLVCADFIQGEYHCMASQADSIYGPYGPRYLAVPHAGHNMLFKDKEGRWWSTFFGNDPHAPFRERPGLLRIEWDAAGRIRPEG